MSVDKKLDMNAGMLDALQRWPIRYAKDKHSICTSSAHHKPSTSLLSHREECAQEEILTMSKQEGSGMPWAHLLPPRLYSAYAQCAPLPSLSQYQFGLAYQGAALHHYDPSSMPASMPGLYPHLHHLPYPAVAAAALAIAPGAHQGHPPGHPPGHQGGVPLGPHAAHAPGSPEPPFRLRSSGNVTPTS